MKRILKKGVAVILALMCVMNFMVMIASAATIVASGTYEENKNLKWTVDSAGTLTISGSGAMPYRIKPGLKPWGDAVVKKIVVKEGVTHIGNYAFSNMYDLKEVSFPKSIRFVGEGIFDGSSYSPMKDSYGVAYEDNILLDATDKNMKGSYKVKEGTIVIADSAFYNATSLSSVVLPKSLASIGEYAFSKSNLTSVTIPEKVEYIGDSAFGGCSSLKEIIVPQSVTEMGEAVFSHCDSLQKASIRGRVSEIKINTFYSCSNLKVLELPSTLAKIGKYATLGCDKLTDVYYEGTQAQKEKIEIINIGGCNEEVLAATWHYNHKFPQPSTPSPAPVTPSTPSVPVTNGKTEADPGNKSENTEVVTPSTPPIQNGYNRGEETYKFTNYMDFHFEGFSFEFGHCFGMAVTSSGYYVNLININEKIGLSDSSKLYLEAKDDHKFFKTGANTHTDPICHYQNLQGSSFKKSIVAGGSWWGPLTQKVDLANDWNEVVAYIQDGSHNDKGDSLVVYKGDLSGQHAVNFLRCEGTGEDIKIYVYDNNYPEDDNIYFYKKDGKIYCNFSSGNPEVVESICICDIAKYLNVVDGVSIADIVYSEEGDIKVTYTKDGETKETEEFPMIGCEEPVVMHEIGKDVETVTITALVDDAQFVYMENTYSVDKGEEVNLNIVTSREEDSTLRIPGKEKAVTLKNNATITLAPSVYMAESYTVSYTTSDAEVASVDENGVVTANGAGKATVICTVKDEAGNVIVEDTYEITVTDSSMNRIIVVILVTAVAVAVVITVIIIKKRNKKG